MSVKLRNSIVCKEKVEWTQGQRWEDKTLKGNILTIHALFGIQRGKKCSRESSRVQYVRDFKVTSIECKNSILVRYATLGTSLSRNMANIKFLGFETRNMGSQKWSSNFLARLKTSNQMTPDLPSDT